MNGGGGGVPAKGLSPMQQELFNQGKTMVGDFFKTAAPLVREQSNMAAGGLVNKGLQEVDKALAEPSITPGIQSRTAARYGVALTPDQQSAMDQTAALSRAATGVMVKNSARGALVNTQRDMVYGGVGV